MYLVTFHHCRWIPLGFVWAVYFNFSPSFHGVEEANTFCWAADLHQILLGHPQQICTCNSRRTSGSLSWHALWSDLTHEYAPLFFHRWRFQMILPPMLPVKLEKSLEKGENLWRCSHCWVSCGDDSCRRCYMSKRRRALEMSIAAQHPLSPNNVLKRIREQH